MTNLEGTDSLCCDGGVAIRGSPRDWDRLQQFDGRTSQSTMQQGGAGITFRAAKIHPTLARICLPRMLSSPQVRLEEVHGALPGQGRGRLVVARRGVVVEPVLRARIREHLVLDVVRLERGLERRDA